MQFYRYDQLSLFHFWFSSPRQKRDNVFRYLHKHWARNDVTIHALSKKTAVYIKHNREVNNVTCDSQAGVPSSCSTAPSTSIWGTAIAPPGESNLQHKWKDSKDGLPHQKSFRMIQMDLCSNQNKIIIKGALKALPISARVKQGTTYEVLINEVDWRNYRDTSSRIMITT